jgi:hypothetical protein
MNVAGFNWHTLDVNDYGFLGTPPSLHMSVGLRVGSYQDNRRISDIGMVSYTGPSFRAVPVLLSLLCWTSTSVLRGGDI